MIRNDFDPAAFACPRELNDFPNAEERRDELRRLAAVLRFFAWALNRIADALAVDPDFVPPVRPASRKNS